MNVMTRGGFAYGIALLASPFHNGARPIGRQPRGSPCHCQGRGSPMGDARECLLMAVRPEGADHQWRENPPGELSIDPVADERLVWVTVRVGAS